MEHIQKKNRIHYFVTRNSVDASWQIEHYSQPFNIKEIENLTDQELIMKVKEVRNSGDVLLIDMKDYKYLVDNGLDKD